MTAALFIGSASVLPAQDFGEMIRSSAPLSPLEEQQTFTVPDGFQVQLFASEPQIQKPMNMAFDARGRLWVSGSNDYPFPNFTENATDSIRILEDTDGDGRADRYTTFVEGITIPLGLYPYQDGVIAFSIPNITFYRDTDADGQADQREVLYGPFDYSRDTHGLNNAFRRGLDGWIYACHGFNNHSQVAGRDGHTVSMQSGNTYRFQIDGSRIEQHTHGQVNPFGMSFDHFGDLYNSDCHTKPVTLLLRDGYYPSFGKPHDGLGFVPQVMEHLHGSTAIAGLAQYTGGQFPAEYENSLFVGNVMTSRVHRDRIVYTGSTVHVEEQPDFLTSSDPWFRPVDIQAGPDGALYIADFYNRIIGHYEVPLDHPGRDRQRGRIWRVTYVGDKKHPSLERPLDLTKQSAEELVSQLAAPNLPSAYRVVEQLVERIGTDAVPVLQAVMTSPATSQQHAYALWALHRLKSLTPADLRNASQSREVIVPIHVQRILGDLDDWSDEQRQLALAGLQDVPIIRRAAAEALGKHPDVSQISHLIKAYYAAPVADVHLQHACKIALRNSLLLPGAYQTIANETWTDEELAMLSKVSLAVKTPAAAQFLLKRVGQLDFSDGELQDIITLAARYVDVAEVPQIVDLCRSRFVDDVDRQLELFQALNSGLRQGGRAVDDQMLAWGTQLVASILDYQDNSWADWMSLAIENQQPLEWGLEQRTRADGKTATTFLSSLPAGERATGVLKSKKFKIPEKLSFFVCGHLGFPDQTAVPKNFVSLHLDGMQEPVRQSLAPRNDIAQEVIWDLSEFAGQRGYLQVTDGIDLRAYAWIGISAIQPPVVQIPSVDRKTINGRLIAAASICRDIEIPRYERQFAEIALNTSWPDQVRLQALHYVLSLNWSVRGGALISLMSSDALSTQQKNGVAAWIVAPDNMAFLDLLKTFPLTVQTAFARALTESLEGARLLFKLIESGTIAAAVLQSEVVRTQLDSLNHQDVQQQLNSLQVGQPDGNQQIENLISKRRIAFVREAISLTAGKEIFQKKCSTCHSIGGAGKQIGPQLDGVGNRGLDRLLEDILAPNRNIDIAFRSRSYLLKNGKVQSGLYRRNEGELTIIANAKGEEISFLTRDIEAEKMSSLSIMPENWGDLITPEDFNDLLGYLLSQQQQSLKP